MKSAIMQPYYFPYIGYFQLINVVDIFVVYDDIEYSKKGWINRNRILINGKDSFITIPLKKDSDYLYINQRFIADKWNDDKYKMLNRISESYKKAPHYSLVFNLLEKIILFENGNLFNFIYNSINEVKNYLELKTNLVKFSELIVDKNLKGKEKVLAICKTLNSREYINAIGGQALYNKVEFANHNIDLKFLKTNPISYKQFNNDFIPWLSIIDVMMFNSKEEIKSMLNQYELI